MSNEEDILKALNGKKLSSRKGWIVLFDGERLIMESGKLIWKVKHNASNALLYSIKEVTGLPTTQKNSLELREIISQLEQEGRIKYIEV